MAVKTERERVELRIIRSWWLRISCYTVCWNFYLLIGSV